MEIEITSHDILFFLQSDRWLITEGFDGSKTHNPLGFHNMYLKQIQNAFPKKSIKEIKYSIDLLIENRHIDKSVDSLDWLNIIVKCNDEGEKAYDTNFYIRLKNKREADESDNYFKRHYVLVTIVLAAVTSIITTLITKWLS